MKKITLNLAGLVLLLSPFTATAHPGHGPHDHDGGYTIIHYFTQPSHAIVMVAVLAFVIIVVKNLRRKDQKA
jgi:hydrogenase/urease accessory protein HupE